MTDTLISSQSSSSSPGNVFSSRYNSITKRLLIGPAFRLELQNGFGLEFDALWQRVNFDTTTSSVIPLTPPSSLYSFGQTTANRWQFPLLLEYAHALPGTGTRLFLDFGPSISHIANSRSALHSVTTLPVSSSATSTTVSDSSVPAQGGTQAGIAVGGGIDTTLFHLHLRPQIRYSHWFSTTGPVPTGVALSGSFTSVLVTPLAPVAPAFRTQADEASFLLELIF